MASSLRFIASNFVTRSLNPTVISASRFLSYRSYSTRPTVADIFCNQSWPRIVCPAEIYSMSFYINMMDEERNLQININDDDIALYVNLPGIKREDMITACADQYKTSFIQDKTQLANKEDVILNIIDNVVANFRDITAKRYWPYSDMFSDRSIIGQEICPAIGMLSPINAFSISMSTSETWMNIYHHKVKLTKQGLRLSEYFLKREDDEITSFFDYDTFFVEHKSKWEHNITGICLPKGMICKKHMIKTKMVEHNGFVKLFALIPCVKNEGVATLHL